jgi:hypothetical protein
MSDEVAANEVVDAEVVDTDQVSPPAPADNPPAIVPDVSALHAALDAFLAEAEKEFGALEADAVAEIRLGVTKIRNVLHAIHL